MQTLPRLYQTFQPTYYALQLTLDRVGRQFHGQVDISGNYSPSRSLTFHAKDLVIRELFVDDAPVQFRLSDDEVSIESELKAGEHRVRIIFDGTITDPMHGLYPCYYDHDGTKKELLATQFESHHAREVFPCIDEPEAKAIFDLTLITETGVSVLGNMPLKTQTHAQTESNQSLISLFESSPRMSPYLLAFVVGELHRASATTQSGVEVNIWATPAQAPASLEFALETAVKSIEFFDDYFGTPYPLPKADHVALPDFGSGAMENWGLITYREVCLLADTHTSVSTREYVAMVIAHETSHQWFGNLVTMKWWDDLWLNESFATLMEYMCVDQLFPSWNIWMTFATNETLSAVRRDYLPGVQAVKVEVNHPDEISTLFDPSIVYAKGARLLAMLHHYVGDTAFRAGLTEYFKQHAYQNTVGQDLWTALSSTSEHDIAAFMTPWLEQAGLPIVHIDRKHIRQERFVLGGENPTPDVLWPIPLASNQASLPKLLTTRDETYALASDETKINVGGRGHYIAHYASDDMLASRIAAIADGSETDPGDRLTLLHDASLLARAGIISAADLFDLAQAYQNEMSEPVWDIISLVIADLKRFVETSAPHEKKFKQHISQLARQTYERLGWDVRDSESEADTKLRATTIGLLAYADDEAIIKKALIAYRAATDLTNLPGEIRAIIFVVVAKHGTADDFQRLLDVHASTHLAELKGDISAGLTAAQDSDRIAQLIGLLKVEATIRLQDVDRWFVYLIRNRYAREPTWQWMTDNWNWIEEKFAGDKSYDNFARYSASALSTHDWLARYEDFFEPKKTVRALTRAIELGESDIQARADWLKRDKAAFLQSL